MSCHFKARYAIYDSGSGCYINGRELIINMAHVVRFEEYNLGSLTKADDVIGRIFTVETTNDHSGYSLKVTSTFLEGQLEHTT